MVKGWVKLHRQVVLNDFLMHDDTAYVLFTKLLLICNPKTGEFWGGRYQLAERVNMNPSTVYKALKRLEANRLVTLSSNIKYTKIHICNWSKYQTVGNSSGISEVTAREQRGNTLVRIKNKNKEESATPANGAGYRKFKKAQASLKAKA